MKKLLMIFLALMLVPACEKNAGQDIWCQVTLHAVLPSGEIPLSLTADESLKGTMLQNINTMDNYSFPVLVDGMATVRVLKGLYMIAFDADALLADGTTVRVRTSLYNSPEKAVRLTDDAATVDLPLTVLK